MRLRKMTAEEFARFREFSIADYGREIAAISAISQEEAHHQAQQEFDGQLSFGIDTPGNAVMVIGDNAGYIWYQIGETRGVRHAFLCDFYVIEDRRRKGIATTALACMEADAQAHGCAELRLYVWAHNLPAQALYKKCGYIPAKTDDNGMYMKKLL